MTSEHSRTHSRAHSQDSRASTESRLSRYSDDELRAEFERRFGRAPSNRNESDRRSEPSISSRQFEGRQEDSPDKANGCCGGGGSSSSRLPKYPSRGRPRTPSQGSPIINLAMLADVTLAAMTPRFTRPRYTPPHSTSYQQTPVETPPETPIGGSPQFSYATSPIETYYDVDEDGWIVADNRGNLVLGDLHRLMDVYMQKNMFQIWQIEVPDATKQMVIDIIHKRFPNPLVLRVKDNVLKSRMCKLQLSRRSDLSRAIKKGYKKPGWCDRDTWKKALQVHEEAKRQNKYKQQREARQSQLEAQGTSRLGSGGKSCFKALFRATVGRAPTQNEIKLGKKVRFSGVLAELEARGIPIQKVDFRSVGPSLLTQTGEYDEDKEEDEEYLPSDEDEYDTQGDEEESESDKND